MKSIQTKIVFLVVIGITVSTILIGGVGIMRFDRVIDDDSVQIMNLLCDENAEKLNNVLGRIEQSVEIMSVYAIDNLESVEKISNDSEYLEKFTQELTVLGLNVANATSGSIAIYIRFNQDITSSMAGFFKVKNQERGTFEDFELTDIKQYSSDDLEHVGWYYIPIQKGEPIWMQPYYNKNIDVYMISYIIPIYKDNTLVGIVGMDIDFDYILRQVDDIKIYDTGEAFLVDDSFQNVYGNKSEISTLVKKFGEDFEGKVEEEKLYDLTLHGKKRKITVKQLANGMYLGVMAPVSEIDSTKNQLLLTIVCMACLIVMVFIFVTSNIAKSIVKPLKKLTMVAREIAGGNLNVLPDCKTKDEVGILSDSLKEMTNKLKIQIDYINNLAYMDKLTGIKNNTAYLNEVSKIKADLSVIEFNFAVFIVDINGLKYINDNYGHEYGNQLISEIVKVLVDVFEIENVYRIGGDEFAILLRNVDSEECKILENEFEKSLMNYEGEIKPSAAIGSAVYDEETDAAYEEVFQRADERMYESKLKMKEQGETSSVR